MDPYYAGNWALLPGAAAMAVQPGDPGTTWRPPGISGPWPADEYVLDGGDAGAEARVRADWTIVGLEAEDTIAHYDTKDGRVVVEPSNRVPIYAPRFAAVRKVYGSLAHDKHERLATAERSQGLEARGQRLSATAATQPLEPGRYDGAKRAHGFRENVRGMDTAGAQPLAGLYGGFLPYENFKIIRAGHFDDSEKARLAERLQAALAWTGNQGVQVTINKLRATAAVNHADMQSVYQYEVPPGKPRLRLVKVASREQAQPGDEIEFTLRFDNVGDQTIGNVTVADSLSPRLEYIAGSAQCSLSAKFLSQDNEGESLVLRWEITDPLAVAAGGVIRFKCKVR